MDELRRLPHSLEAEQAVVGSMLLDSRCIPDAIELLQSGDFYLPAHRDIFETIYEMFLAGDVVDPVTVLGRMRVRGVYDETTSREYVGRLLDATPTAAHVRQYSSIVREQSILRQVAQVAGDIQALALEPAVEAHAVLDSAEQRIYDIRQGRSSQDLYKIPVVLVDVYRQIKELSEAGGRLPGLSTGFPSVDLKIGGLINSNLIILASRPGMGKTSIALNIALHATRSSGKTVVFFSLEMSREQLVKRLLSTEASVDSNVLLTGALSPQDWSKVGAAAAALSNVALLFDDNPAISVAEIKAKCRRVTNLGMIVVDYLQLMQGTPGKRFDNRTTEVGDISRSLKIMAKELDVPVVCLSQLSRETAKRGKKPVLSDLRESGAIEQDADVVLFLHRDDYYNEESTEHNLAQVIIGKNRHGETGEVDLLWEGQYTRFAQEWRQEGQHE